MQYLFARLPRSMLLKKSKDVMKQFERWQIISTMQLNLE